MADQYGAPFTETAISRLNGNVFGTGRATRSSDIVLFNKSSKSFKLDSKNCTNGDFSTGLTPENEISSKESTVYGYDSVRFASGCECTTKYTSSDGSYFQITVDNPYTGSSSITTFFDLSLKLLTSKDFQTSNNNQVRFVIEDK